MAAAFKCDLCGSLYEDYDGFQYDEQGGSYFKKIVLSSKRDYSSSTSRYFDTCPDCMRAVIDFMNSRTVLYRSRKEKTNGVQ